MGAGNDRIDDAALLAEQRDFYRADAEAFDQWLATLLDERNDEPVAQTYRAGRSVIADVFETYAPLGHALEIAAGTGRLAPLYLPHADSVVLLDSSPESLAIAGRRLRDAPGVHMVEADVFDWPAPGRPFDTIVFSAWLHHVPLSRFDEFWGTVESLLTSAGRVIFDFPDARVGPPGEVEIPDEPTAEYGFYAPVDGISTRDHFGVRWRVVHNLWDPEELGARLSTLGWNMTVLGSGLAAEMRWAHAARRTA